MKKLRKTKIRVDVYDVAVIIAVHADLKMAAKAAMGRKAFKAFVRNNGKRWFDDAHGAQFTSGNKHLIVLRPDATFDTIVHEAFHVCEHILVPRGLDHRGDPDEAWAYLVGYVAGETIEAFKRLTK